MAKVTFYGACGCVTGSCTHLSWSQTQILVDCGMYQGDRDLKKRNWQPFPFDPKDIDAVIITHAHLDHTGLLPRLVKMGFQGVVYCTRPTRGLMSLVLQDSAKIQQEQARWAAKKGYSRHKDPKPLYTTQDVRQTLRLVKTVPFHQTHEVLPGIRLEYRRAGHLLGAASLNITAKGSDGNSRTWCFSGDIGRYDVPILKDPETTQTKPDALLLESTYGDRAHEATDPKSELYEIIRTTFDRGGSVIIPAFALGRSQEVLYYLAELVEEQKVDPRAVFLDSPMAIKATRIYDSSVAEHDEELQELDDTIDPLSADPFQHCSTSSQSKALNKRKSPAVIVASSGMATGGRVLHHLAQKLGNPRHSVVFVGYQAAGTRGRVLTGGADTVSIYGQRVRVRAQIHSLHGLSAHAGRKEILRWCDSLPVKPERIFLNHGEDQSRRALAAVLEDEGWARPGQPSFGDSVPW
ncbi:MAG: MBL fold metallo-hydrolase [Deltaproteobacteria bacterium]|nr:MBL fold metallo-hydrolase [Deltaproteobacteria bacterium]